MKLSDYVADFLSKQGIRHAFVVTECAAAHIIDSLAKNPKIKYVCTQQASFCVGFTVVVDDGLARCFI